MPIRIHEPGPPLRRYVDYMWRVDGPNMPPSRQPVYPDGAMALVLHLRRPTASWFIDDKPHSIRVPLIAGPYSRSFQIDPSQSVALFGVHFRPGASRLFYPLAAHELHNTDVALSDLIPGEADRLLNDMCSARDPEAQFRVMEDYLSLKVAAAPPIHPAIDYAVRRFKRPGGPLRIREVQSQLGLSHTRFIQLFREHVGLTPKLFCRVSRFRHSMDHIRKGIPVNWAELALACGYFDQAHLIRDFQAFAGTTPLAYSREFPSQKS